VDASEPTGDRRSRSPRRGRKGQRLIASASGLSTATSTIRNTQIPRSRRKNLLIPPTGPARPTDSWTGGRRGQHVEVIDGGVGPGVARAQPGGEAQLCGHGAVAIPWPAPP